jgi:histidinol-phosphatase
VTLPAYGAEWSASLRRGSEAELSGWLALALSCCDEADRLARAAFRRDMEVTTKPDLTLVTTFDRSIEASIRERIRALHPDHGLIGEEHGDDDAGAAVRWYIDPIDGTHNFVRGVPLFGTLLAVERDGELQLGVMSAPELGERWFAWRGGGAWAMRTDRPGSRERPIHASAVERIGDAQILYSSVGAIERSGRAPGFSGLLEAAWRDRGFGDFWGYALVAEGAAEAMIEVGVKSWDLAAPTVVVEEAGGLLTDFAGQRGIETETILASNGRLHRPLLEALRTEPS